MLLFFFSSRRRHTRCSRDWSSDVCSSDLLSRACRPLALEMISGRLPCAGLPGNAGAVAAAPFGSDHMRPKSLPAPATALPISEVRKNLRRDHSSIEEPPPYAEGTIQQLLVDS